MTDIYPGATWIDTGDAGAMSGLRGCTWHEAVTRGTVQDIASWVRDAKSCHLFNGQQGDCGQYIRVGRKAYGVKDGNHNLLTVESYDGLKILENPYREIGIGGVYGDSANTGRWDDGQFERAADIMAWLYLDHGVPIQMMPDSRPSSTGHAPHRWGVDPWRVAGGELWTRSAGKPCPGDLRIGQMPAIVSRAKIIAAAIQDGRCTYLPPGPVNVTAALARTAGAVAPPPVQPIPATTVDTTTTTSTTEEPEMVIAHAVTSGGNHVYGQLLFDGIHYIKDAGILGLMRRAGAKQIEVTRDEWNAARASGTGAI